MNFNISNTLRRLPAVLLLAAAVLMSVPASAQGLKVSGTVTDENGEPLLGASVTVSGTAIAAVTDVSGNYTLTVPDKNSILEISTVNYATQQVLVDGRKTVNVTLRPDASNALNEIVTIGYGSVKKQDLTGAVSSLKMDDIENATDFSLDKALQGRIAGVEVISTGGEPGGLSAIRIRGVRSINGSNEPLVVVDGIVDAVGDITEINPADVASVSILKDASATAIYGARGANGVIMVTTRQGITSKPSITARAEFGVSQIAGWLDVMDKDEFVRYSNDCWYFADPAYRTKLRYDPADFKADTDWMDEITRIAPYQNYNLSLSGKTGKVFSYYGSLFYNGEQGVVKNSGNDRIGARMNLSFDAAKWLTVNLKFSYVFRRQNQNKANFAGDDFADGAFYLPPTMAPDDAVNPILGHAVNSPVSCVKLVDLNREIMTNTDAAEFIIKPVKGLTIKSLNSYMVYQRHDYQFWPGNLPKRVEGEGSEAGRYEGDAREFNTENTVAYNAQFGNNQKLEALIGFSASKFNMNRFALGACGLVTDDLKWNNMASVISKDNYSASTGSGQVIRESVFARINWNFQSRYYVTASLRADGSSSFAANNKWGIFPAAAFKWSLKNESWLKDNRNIDNLALRLSAGVTGNDAIGAFNSLGAYTVQPDGYLFSGNPGASVYPVRVAHPDLRWERTMQYDVAVDAAFFNHRLSFTAEAYRSDTDGLLMTLPVMQSTGFSGRLANVGRTVNKGLELTVEGRIIEKNDFVWASALTASCNEQKVVETGLEQDLAVLTNPGEDSYMMYGVRNGHSIGALWGFQYAGVWHNQKEVDDNAASKKYASQATSADLLGLPKYVDQNHDGRLDGKDIVCIGNSDPWLHGGWQNSFSWKGLKASLYFTYALGGQIYNYPELYMGGGSLTNQYRYMADAWHPVRNAKSDIPRAGSCESMLPSDFNMHDASYIRLQNASISYTFDFTKKKKHVLRDLTLSLSGSNLLLLTGYNGYDPDIYAAGSVMRRVDMGAYPGSRTLIFGVQIRY